MRLLSQILDRPRHCPCEEKGRCDYPENQPNKELHGPIAQTIRGGKRLGLVDLAHDSPFQVPQFERAVCRQHADSTIIWEDFGVCLARQCGAGSLGVYRLEIDRCVKCVDLLYDTLVQADPPDHAQISLTVLDQEPRLVAHQQVIGDDVGLAAFAQPDVLPCATTCHDVVDPVDRHLENQNTGQFAAIVDRRRDEGRRCVVGRGIGLEIPEQGEVA